MREFRARVSAGHWMLWGAGVAGILFVHIIWEHLNRRPPAWDMAHHQLMGWEYLQAWLSGDFWSQFSVISNYYPPLYYLQEAMVLYFFGWTQFLPLLANLTGLFLLSFSTFRLASILFSPTNAAIAAWVVLTFPLVAWTSRESLLDVPLAGWVALTLLTVVRTDWLNSRSAVPLLSLVLTCGMLTKWTYCLFLAPAVLFCFFTAKNRKRVLVHILLAGLLAQIFLLPWYLPNAENLVQRFQLTSQAAAFEQDPHFLSLSGILYYPRSLLSYYLYLPLGLCVLVALVRFLVKSHGHPVEKLLWLEIGASMLLLTLLEAKDPRYLMPVASPVAIVLFSPLRRSRPLALGVGLFAILQFLSISFSVPLLPNRVAIGADPDASDYTVLSREWVLYQSHYFDIAGPPRQEDWHLVQIAERIPSDARVGFLPDMPFFHPLALKLTAVKRGKRLMVFRLGLAAPDQRQLDRVQWVVGKEGEQGISYITSYNEEFYRRLEGQTWQVVGEWQLPDQSRARLWRKRSLSR